MASPSLNVARNSPRPKHARSAAHFLLGALGVFCALAGAACTPSAQPPRPASAPPAATAPSAAPAATQPAQAPGQPGPAAAVPKGSQIKGPIVDESFSIRHDEDLYQLEEAVTLIAGSLSRISDKVSTLAINSFSFGKDVDRDFRTKAEVIILEKLLDANQAVRLVQCQECQKLETKIVSGVLRLRKGIPSQEARKELAKKLGVDGFIDIGMFRDGRQLTIYIKVVEAETGGVILVDEMVGRQAAKRDAVTLSFGQITFPIQFRPDNTTRYSNALAFTATEQIQLIGRWSFGVDAAIYTDTSTVSGTDTNTNPHVTITGGVLLSPFVGFDVLQIPQSTSRVIATAGIGELIDPQLNFARMYRGGLQVIVGDRLVITYVQSYYETTDLKPPSSTVVNAPTGTTGERLSGSAYELRFGYRF